MGRNTYTYTNTNTRMGINTNTITITKRYSYEEDGSVILAECSPPSQASERGMRTKI